MCNAVKTISMGKYAVVALMCVVALNIVLRSTFKINPVVITLVIAGGVAGLMAIWFAAANGRAPSALERRRFLWVYGGLLALVFVGMALKDPVRHGATGVGYVMLWVHYLPYPVFALVFLSKPAFNLGSKIACSKQATERRG